MCGAKCHVRFTPNSDRESEIPQTVMSALLPKADMCGALAHVCFGPIADIARKPNRKTASRRSLFTYHSLTSALIGSSGASSMTSGFARSGRGLRDAFLDALINFRCVGFLLRWLLLLLGLRC